MQLGPVTLWLLLIAIITDAWWASGSHVILDPRMVCKKNRRLRGRLAHICQNETGILREITRGVSLGALECGSQFKHRRWNCTTQRRSMRKILMRDTRETGFVNAITAAGVTYAITRGCTMGTLLECSCEKGPPTRPIKKIISTLSPNDVWQWGGCGDNVRFGLRKSREFMDNQRKKSDIKTLIKRHNYNAGRLALKNYMRLECKCHGLSGSCTVKTCWVKMPTFREVGNRLFERFNAASKVIASNDGDSFLPENSTKRPRKQDLIYSEESPDFCTPNLQTGSLGTAGRECNASSAGPDGCKTLCCGRRFLQKTVTEMKNCFCEFTWCCKVSCNVCYSKKEFASCL